MKYSVIIPVYKNETSIPFLIQALILMNQELNNELEVVFVVDGSPDNSYVLLLEALNTLSFPAQVIVHSRNFGSFSAIRTGLIAARGQYFAVMAADLQEPSTLLFAFFNALATDECDVTIGIRGGRKDPLISRLTSGLFWKLYKRFIIPDMPAGGVDVFGCNQQFRKQLLQLEESRSSLIALIFWLGFRRKLITYERQERRQGLSTWTLRKKNRLYDGQYFCFYGLSHSFINESWLNGLSFFNFVGFYRHHCTFYGGN